MNMDILLWLGAAVISLCLSLNFIDAVESEFAAGVVVNGVSLFLMIVIAVGILRGDFA